MMDLVASRYLEGDVLKPSIHNYHQLVRMNNYLACRVLDTLLNLAPVCRSENNYGN